jgi:hypothetical protein
MDQSALSAREAAELEALRPLVTRGKIMPGTASWDRYLELTDRASGAAAAQPDDGFRLDPAPIHSRGVAAYVGLYCVDGDPTGATTRRLQRWRKLGAENGQPAPLGDPSAMIGWYESMRGAGHIKHAIPDMLLDAAARASAPPTINESLTVAVATAAEPLPAPVAEDEDMDGADYSTRSVIARLQQDEARLHRRYQLAVANGAPEAEQEVLRKRWSEASELLIMQRARAEKVRELLDPLEVNSALVRFLPALANSLVAGLAAYLPTEQAAAAVRAAFAAAPNRIEEFLAA